jgi:hypothetical protein
VCFSDTCSWLLIPLASINAVNIVCTRDICILYFLAPFEPIMPFTVVLYKRSSQYSSFNFQTFRELPYLLLCKTYRYSLLHFETFRHDEKTNLIKTIVNFVCINQTSWSFARYINERSLWLVPFIPIDDVITVISSVWELNCRTVYTSC